MPSVKVGVDEFRENLAKYLESSETVTVTRNGETVGTFLPARRKPSREALERMHRLGEQVRAAMAAAGVTEDELVEEFERLRREARLARSVK